jgi:hypothetical protein
MRFLASAAALCVLFSSATGGIAAQSVDTDMPIEAGLEDPEEPIEEEPIATPQVIYVLVTATPEIAATSTPTRALYTTRSGPRTEENLRAELAAAGYGGPWDIHAVLAAYDRATAPAPTPFPRRPTLTPLPAPDYSGACFQLVSSLSLQATSRLGPSAAGAFSPASLTSLCVENAHWDGSAGVQCTQFAVQQLIDFIAIAVQYRLLVPVTPPSIGSLYAGCMGRG